LLEHGLADELVLMVDPVLLGAGKRLFQEGTPPRAFTLESTRTTPTGIVVQSYKAAGGLVDAAGGGLIRMGLRLTRTVK
jgi:dihydrofolate reductase